MTRKLNDNEVNAVWTAVENILGLPRKEVAVVVRDDGYVEADCMMLKKIPEHSLRKLQDGFWFEEDDERIYVEARGVEDPRQLILNVETES